MDSRASFSSCLLGICVGTVMGIIYHFAHTTGSMSVANLYSPTAVTTGNAVTTVVPAVTRPLPTTRMAVLPALNAQINEADVMAPEAGEAAVQAPEWSTGPLLAAAVAFVGGLIAGRRWKSREEVAIAPTSGYPEGYFTTRPHPSSGRLEPLWGRRSAKIAMTKGREDLRRSKLYARYGKKIIMAVKAGGSADENANLQLRDVLREAREANVPNANIERALKRSAESGSADYKESVFEAYGKGGAGILITVLTDNANRASSEVKTVVGRAGLTIASPGSVAFNFRRMGAIVCPKEVDEDVAIEAAMEAEADDVIVKENEDGEWLVIAEPKDLMGVKTALIAKGVECGETKLLFHPTNTVDCNDADYDLNMAAIEKLEDLDDVDAVAHNMV